jgi:peptide/nickel transport system substrate-binding protein
MLNSRIGYAVLIIMILSVAPNIAANYPIDGKPKYEGFNQTRFLQEGNQTIPKYGGTLRIGRSRYYTPDTLNPLISLEKFYFNYYPVFNSLLRYSENGTLLPDLAEEYEVLEDGLSYAFHISQNVSWHDGAEFNTSDIKFTFDTIYNDPEVDYRWKDYYAYGINSTEILNASTIVFHLNESLGSFPFYLPYVPILPRHIYEGTDLATNPANEEPVGTGPFKFTAWTPKTNLTVEANEGYFRGRPYLDRVTYDWDFGNLELTDALKNNVIDLTVGVDPGRIDELENTIGTTVTHNEQASFSFVGLNMNNPILNNSSVRKAMAHAINRTRIVWEAYYGHATPASGPLPPSLSNWYNPNVTGYDYNQTLAEEVLDQACPRNPDWRFDLTVKSFGGNPWIENAAYSVVEGFRAVGINATVQFCNVWDSVYAGDFDAAIIGWAYDAFSPDDLYSLFRTGALGNWWNYSNPELDLLLDEGRSSLNDTERKTLFSEAEEMIAADLPSLFLFHSHHARGFNNDFHGGVSEPFIQLPLTTYFLENTWYDPTLSGEGNCPMLVSFIDSLGRRTGYDAETGEAVAQIPESSYSGLDSDPQLVKISSPSGNYTIELYGTGNGSYSLEIVNLALGYKHTDLPTSNIRVNQTKKYYVQVFSDGSMSVFDCSVDINSDLAINILDAITLSNVFLTTPSSPNWNPNADINSDDAVNILDAITLSNYFLEHYP